ncbi:[FeFe] hydrogenase H-cluster maturation GTPase HydF [Campylobacter pinnipediorum subsp. caledonicus]|uniref:[FeFe] hydrogenase H-cluster maturation GTPase HydF n=1 Tax=Campylobacter pinnipediorum subsp. caledonicus TaxID=1874362 RepID=A0A1S6U6K2_9BACT|nr:[FeFe] hydrogenase H-cluster maturation GTPase HydF [Campylobacter pinnipediorum]AQW87376.1 [FeFe] hydrogenase H-cluster maturation GTPase HydF [Campylobacter pinnipediorum subsp. caledonicus]
MNTPKLLRLKIGIFGRRNVGKSSIMNMLSDQDASIVSDVAGTTTDVVEKSIEIHGIGAAVLLDTAGVDDVGELGAKRILKTKKAIDEIDIAILVLESNKITDFETDLIADFKQNKKPFLIFVNKCDTQKPNDNFLKQINEHDFVLTSAKTKLNLEEVYDTLLKTTKKIKPDESSLFDGILKEEDLVLLVAPIDEEAPKDRLILPQVQAIRKILDNKAFSLVTQDSDISKICQRVRPDLIVCDSQCVLEVIKTAPKDINITTFSILMSRLKGDLKEFILGANKIDELKNNDKILIAEACTHNTKDGDIARVKIPKLLRKFTQKELEFHYTNGKDYPDNLNEFAVIIHCGGCMINKNLMQSRINKAKNSEICITNYGIAISKCQGVLDRVIKIFDF